MRSQQKILHIILATFLLSRCATKSEAEKKELEIQVATPVVRYELANKTHYPLPSYKLVFVDWSLGTMVAKSSLAARAWDFNADDAVDMLELLDGNGASSGFYYDFDGDGQVDFKKQ